LNNYNFLKMCVIGVIPLLMTVDCLSSAALCSLLYFCSTSVSIFALYCLKNINYRAKYLLAVMLSFCVNYFIYSNFLAGKYCTGGYWQFIVYVSSLSVAGIYFDYEFKHFNDFFDLIKYYSMAAASSTFIFFAYGFLVYIFTDKTGNKITFFSYPASAIITAALCGLIISKALKKTS